VDGCAVKVGVHTTVFVGLLILTRLSHRCSGEGENDELPAELRNAVAVADSLLEPSAVSENSSTQKNEEEKEESTTSDGKGNEESASKVRTHESIMMWFLVLTEYVFFPVISAPTAQSGNAQGYHADTRGGQRWTIAWLPERVFQSAFALRF
jgi:hypothetical protein